MQVKSENLIALEKVAMEYNASGHSIFGPSSSAMWLYCSGSLIANLMEPSGGSFEAAEGTVAHGLGEEWLRSGKRPTEKVGTTVRISEKVRGKLEHFDILITNTMLDYVQQYVEWCQELPGDHFVETRVYFSEYMPIPKQGGTADHAACTPGRLVVTDFKYGKGIEVSVNGNTQGLLYALGFFLKYDCIYDFKEIEIRICQPRMLNWGIFVVTREELLEFADFVRVRAKEAWQIDAPRRASEKACQWCSVKGDCPALLMTIDALMEGRWEDIDREYDVTEMDAFINHLSKNHYRINVVQPKKLTAGQLAKIRPFRRLAESFFKSVDEAAERLALRGERIPGHKLVSSRSFRKYKDDEKAIELFELIGIDPSKYRKTELVSPAEAEELIRDALPTLPKAQIESIVATVTVKPQGKPTLALLTDKRPEYGSEYDDLLLDDEDVDI